MQGNRIRGTDPLEGLDAFRHQVGGWWKRKTASRGQLRKRAERVDALATKFSDLDAHKLNAEVLLARQGMSCSVASPAQVEKAMALLVGVMDKVIGKRPYTVQVMGALAMHDGWLIEMATGEGKTLTASLTAVLWAWRHGSCHVVTSNDYLAKRDAVEFASFYEACGLTSGYIETGMDFPARQAAYACEITYCTGSSVLADFLRDSLAFDYPPASGKERLLHLNDPSKASQRVMPLVKSAIIDEADSVLADNAVTPLIISLPEEDPDLLHSARVVHSMLAQLEEGEHYKVHDSLKVIHLEPPALQLLEGKLGAFPESWRAAYRVAFLVNKGLMAQHFYHRNEHYVILDGKVVIVDGQTGRPMPEMSWGGGLHQAVEAKEGLELTNPTQASTKMTYQGFFRKYPHLCGMSGTLSSIASELWRIYGLPIFKIPPRLPKRHESLPEQLCATREEQNASVISATLHLHQTGQPVLIGTRSVEESLELSGELNRHNIPHEVLNALEHEREAGIIAKAGLQSQVTIATNMAGRGTDIKPDDGALAEGGLHVIGTEHHDSRRVDNQLTGRASRQGEPGSSQFILSLEDRLPTQFFPENFLLTARRNIANPLFKLAIRWLYKALQWYTERRSSRLRVKMLIHEDKMQKAMSFTGRR